MKRMRLIALALTLLSVLLLLSACSGPIPEERWVPVTAKRAAVTTASLEPADDSTATEAPTPPEPEAPTEPSAAPTSEATTPTAETVNSASAPETVAPVPTEPETDPDRSVPTQVEPEPTKAEPTETEQTEPRQTEAQVHYVANTNSKKFHLPTCSSVTDMKESNKWYFTGSRDELIAQGYEPCKRCKP